VSLVHARELTSNHADFRYAEILLSLNLAIRNAAIYCTLVVRDAVMVSLR